MSTREPSVRTAQTAHTARRWPRRLVGLIVVLAVLGGGAVVAAPLLDDAARGLGERRVAQIVTGQTGATGGVDVAIAGQWFVPQLLHGRYPQIAISAHGVPIADGLRLERVDADLRDVDAPLSDLVGGGELRISTARAEVELAYPVLNSYLREQGRPLVVAPEPGGGQLHVTGSTELLGQELALSGLVDLEVDDGELRAVPDQLDTDNTLLDRLSRTVLRGLRDKLAFTIPLGELPLGQKVSTTEVRSTGVLLTTQGSDIVVAT